MEKEKVIVNFRYVPEYDEVVAVFPFVKASNNGNMLCYAHIGQHSECTQEWVDNDTIQCPKQLYQDLKKELEDIGYELAIECENCTPRDFTDDELRMLYNGVKARVRYDKNGESDADCFIWEKGTDRFQILEWFDSLCANGIDDIL